MVTRLQVGYSARSSRAAPKAMRTAPLAFMPVEYLTLAIEDRAVAVQLLLADRARTERRRSRMCLSRRRLSWPG